MNGKNTFLAIQRFAENQKITNRVIVSACVCLYVFFCLITFNNIEEDAYIYFRVAQNLVDGYGYVFNQLGPPIEVGSSLTWQFLLAGIGLFPIDIVIATKLLGIAFGILTLVLCFLVGKELKLKGPLQFLPAIMLSMSAPFVLWSHLGLETPFYTFSLLLLALVTIRKRLNRYWWVAALLVAVSRPEAILILVGLLPFAYFNRHNRDLFVLPGIGLALSLVAIYGWRFIYFGDFVPHPFYIKVNPGNLRSLPLVHNYLASHYLYLAALPLLFASFSARFWSKDRVVLATYMCVLALWGTTTFDGAKPYIRHFVPSLPFFFIFVALGWQTLFAILPKRYSLFVATAALAAIIVASPIPRSFYTPSPKWARQYPIASDLNTFARSPGEFAAGTFRKILAPSERPSFESLIRAYRPHTIGTNLHVQIGEFVRLNYATGSTVVYDQMGQTPFYAGRDKFFIDSFGLTDRTIGYFSYFRRTEGTLTSRIYLSVTDWVIDATGRSIKRKYSNAEILDYIERHDPDVIMVNRVTMERSPRSFSKMLFDQTNSDDRYRLAYMLGNTVFVLQKEELQLVEPKIPMGLKVSKLN